MRGLVISGLLLALAFGFLLAVEGYIKYSNEQDLMALAGACLSELDDEIRSQCVDKRIAAVTKDLGAAIAMDLVLLLDREEFVEDCHIPAHKVGAANLERYEGNPGPAFATCAPGCIEGCYHGVMEAYVGALDQGEQEKLIDGNVCESVAVSDLLKRQCIHGVGHGLMLQSSYNLMEALESCEVFNTPFEIETCGDGVFMEHAEFMLNVNDHMIKDRVLEICAEVNNDPSRSPNCGAAIGEGLVFNSGYSYSEAKELCLMLQEDQVEPCIDAAKKESRRRN